MVGIVLSSRAPPVGLLFLLSYYLIGFLFVLQIGNERHCIIMDDDDDGTWRCKICPGRREFTRESDLRRHWTLAHQDMNYDSCYSDADDDGDDQEKGGMYVRIYI